MEQIKIEMLHCDHALLTVGPFVVSFNTFTPAEAEALTGVSTGLQRVWRRRGFLPPLVKGEHARFTTLQIAEMTFMGLLSERGFSMDVARIEAHRLGLPLCSHLLWGLAGLSVSPLFGDEIHAALELVRQDNFEDDPEEDDCRYAVSGDGSQFDRMGLEEFAHCRYDCAVVIDMVEVAERMRLMTDRTFFVIDPTDKAENYGVYTKRIHAAVNSLGTNKPPVYDSTGEMWTITIPREDVLN